MMSEDWVKCGNRGVALSETIRKTKASNRICNGLIILHTIGAIAYVAGILLADVDVTDRTTELPLMMKMEYPFVIDTRSKYDLVLATQFVYVMVCSWGAGLFNALFLTLTLHLGSQVNILLCWLAEMEPNKIKEENKSFVVSITNIIQKHQRVINLSENIESLYSYIVLLSKAVGNAAYNSAWYDMKTKESNILLFIILRSQKQLKFTAGKMMDLSFESFTSIMRASASYLSVLLAMK
nr:PREDICTED: uncharacterized protein LOC105670749 [Linepithema humile]